MADPRERLPSIPGLHFMEKLGTGAVGSVYLARDERLRKLVAVKVLRRELAGNRLYIERLRREANLSMRLDHPNIVKGIDLGEAEGSLYFVMEFVDGKTLKTVLRERGRLEEDEVIELGLQVARALDHAYRNGVVHRDIKPGNLLVSPDGTFKLADLGLARRPDDSSVTRDGVTLGTPHYISPEQALDPSSADVRSDLYSLGATLFHAATGHPPFESETVGGVLSQVLEPNKMATIPDDVAISKNLELVLRRLLVKDTNRRYPSPDDLIRDLERVKRRERPQVSIFDVSPAAGRRVRAGIMAVGAVGAVVLLVWGGSKLAGSGGDGGRSQAEAQFAVKLSEIEKGTSADPPAIAERYRRVGALLRIPDLTPALRVRAVDLQARIEEQLLAALGSLERNCDQDLTAATSEGRFGDANELLQRSFPPRFDALFGGGEGLPEILITRTGQFLARKSDELTVAIEKAEEALAAEVPTYLTTLENQVTGLQAQGRFRSALEKLDAAVGGLEVTGGPSWKRMPAEPRERLTEKVNPKVAALRTETLTAARDTAQRIAQRLQREHDRLEEALRSGFVASAASEFEDLAVKTFDETNYVKEEWPVQVAPDPAKLREDLGSALRNLEKERSRAEAERAFGVLDEQLWKRLGERNYSTARNEWQSRLDRSTFAPMQDRMARRLRYCEELVALRDRVRATLVKQIGKRVSLTLRSGAAVSGKLATVEPKEDDILLTFQESNVSEVQFSSLSSSDAEKWAELTEKLGDRFVRGVFWLAEGQSDRARADFAAVRAQATDDSALASSAASALADVDAVKLLTGGAASVREGRFEEARRKARAFAAIGESDLAREWYGNARREAGGFAQGDTRLAELDEEVRQFETTVRDLGRMRSLAQAFPGARARDLDEGRTELTYEFNDKNKLPALDLGEDWRLTPAGVEFKATRTGGAELGKGSGVKLTLGAAVKGPARVALRLTVPFDGKEPAEPIRAFAAFGKAVLFAGGRARHGNLTVVRGGGFDGAEAELKAAVGGPVKTTLGLLRGGTHEIEFSVEADGKGFVVSLDGYVVGRGDGVVLGDVFELRSNAPVVWHSLKIEGKLTPRR